MPRIAIPASDESQPMKLNIPEHLSAIKPYVPGKPLAELEREYGITDSIKLASNENPLGPSPKALDAMIDHARRMNRYPDEPGYDLLQGIAARHGVSPHHIITGNGSDEILGLLGQVLLQPGDEIIVPMPTFSIYANVAQTAGAVAVKVPLADLHIDLDAMAAGVNERTRLIFICNPNNPTGQVVSRRAFESFLNALPARVVVVVDEAYAEFIREPDTIRGMDYLEADVHVVTLRTFSKAFGLAGLRVGYGIMPEQLADILNRVRMPFNVNGMAQAAAVAAMSDHDFLQKTIDLVHQGLDWFYAQLDRRGIRYVPSQSNFFLIDVGRDADEVFSRMLHLGVIVRSMSGYGIPQCIRINAGLPEENRRFLKALDQVLQTG